MSRFKRRLQNFQKGIVTIVACLLIGVVSLLFSQPALALTQVKLFDLSYEVCPAEVGQGVVTSDGSAQPATCYLVKGKAQNDSNKLVINADVFGRIYDANNNPVFQNRNRLGAIDEVPPGVSDFEIRVSIASNQPAPLRLSQFKAAGFTGTVRR